jgi:hypothetical protein
MTTDVITFVVGTVFSVIAALAGVAWFLLWKLIDDLRADVARLTVLVVDLQVKIAHLENRGARYDLGNPPTDR